MNTCPNCGAQCAPGAAVCPGCGAALPVQPPAPPVGAYPQPPHQPTPPPAPPRVMLPTPQFATPQFGAPQFTPPQFARPQRPFCWMDIFTILGFVSSVVGYFFASVLLLPLGLIASIVGFRSDRNRGLAVAGIVISAVGVLIKVMLILSEAALLPDWFTNGIW